MKTITQEESMGCGIACVASVLDISYKKAKDLFEHPEYSNFRGFYCKEMIQALKKAKQIYSFSKFKKQRIKKNTIVFIKRSKKYPSGHYFVKSKVGWMDSWINFPSITPAKSGFRKKISGEIQWIIYPIE